MIAGKSTTDLAPALLKNAGCSRVKRSRTPSWAKIGSQASLVSCLEAAAAASAAVPEPSTWSLMLAGFAGLGLAGARAARKRAGVAA
jgi:PEP-CTERM motif